MLQNDDFTKLVTEQPSYRYDRLDTSSSMDIVLMMNDADRTVPDAVAKCLPQIAQAVDAITERLSQGGRLFYIGAGTSGRLGMLDVAECPPTFGTSPDSIQALMAGGERAFFTAVEGAEDCLDSGALDLEARGLAPSDVVVGIAASGRTPYVIGGLTYAKNVAAATISLACNKNAKISAIADIAIEVETGPEVLMGSTRLKAGTAQKNILNMLSTGAMVRLGKVYRNLMVDLTATNEKLVDRSKRILMHATGASYDDAEQALLLADGHVKTAIVMIERNVDAQTARDMLAQSGGFIRPILDTK